ncbi:hypothetical protein RFF05_03790 [Bengtsoniella intestinalis]|uniref:hypothetical protein n=1 Tax=Bengtsoniella intestinalis TaxID=3073143 RepID=UPI00391F4B56
MAKKRSNGEGALRKRTDGQWACTIMDGYQPDRMGTSICLLSGTGMRMQELLGLEPHHIAPDGSMIYVRQAVQLVKGTIHIGPPKSKDSARDIPVPPNVRHCARFLRNTATRFV